MGAEVDALIRVDRSVADGVLNTAVERNATLVLLGWKGGTTTKDRVLGSLLDDVVDRVPCATGVCWLPGSTYTRIVLIAGDERRTETAVVESFCRRLAKGASLPVVVIGSTRGGEWDPSWELTECDVDSASLARNLGPGDIAVLPGGSTRSIGTLAHELVEEAPHLSVVIVSPPAPSAEAGIPELFGGA